MSEIVFDPDAYKKASADVDDALSFIKAEIDTLLDSVTDYQVLGENDTVGKIANFIYRVFIEAFRETAHGLVEGLADQSETLRAVGELYHSTVEAADAWAALAGKD